jgi:hypothetical protein
VDSLLCGADLIGDVTSRGSVVALGSRSGDPRCFGHHKIRAVDARSGGLGGVPVHLRMDLI